ncbi:MAG: 3-deoxy-manno-octulosonate cytidylyltransferase [Candidatus Kapabacteria bacterium]|nr:3-deoxy-manno-octulosonate cytidylyltransferase [Candidatus Kapabacteria bacterium]
MKVIALIPARYDSTRFPGKMLAVLGDKTVIRTTYEAVKALGIFDDVFVVTDHHGIYEEITGNGGKAIMSLKNHDTGTDRIAEAAENLDADVVFNIQGDEPFVNSNALESLFGAFNDPNVDVATLMQKLDSENEIDNPNFVKVVTDLNDFIIYFSRSRVPYNRDGLSGIEYYEHIGVYAFRKDALLKFSKLSPTPNELAEKVEPIRFLENGMKIKVYRTEYMGIEIDTPEDLIKANELINHKSK